MSDFQDHTSPFPIAEELAANFAQTAIERDKRGGNAKHERDLLRQSGLLNLLIAQEDGGWGASWQEILKIVRLFAKVDSSIAHLFGFQHLMLGTIDLFGSEEQKRYWHQKTVKQSWFWGNALNPLDTSTILTQVQGEWRLQGRKGFSSGSVDADAMILSGIDPQSQKLMVAAVEIPRQGIHILADWDNMGQRQTDSGSVEFENVKIEPQELLRTPGPLGSVRATLRTNIAQLIFANVFLGLAEGAFYEARNYTLAQSKPWLSSNVSSPQEDPYILHHYGELWVGLQAARCLTDRAADTLQRAWEAGDAITENLRGRAAVDISEAKVITTKVGLDITTRIFELMGSRSTTASARLDRFWRNLRTQTLHDPVDYKLKELGDYALNHRLPQPTFYS